MLTATKKAARTRLPSVGYRSWSRFLAVSLQVTWVINPAVGCRYFPPGLQLSTQPLRGLLQISLLGKQRQDGCGQFAQDCYPTASRLWFEPGPYCAWVQHANHPTIPSHPYRRLVPAKPAQKSMTHCCWYLLTGTVNRYQKPISVSLAWVTSLWYTAVCLAKVCLLHLLTKQNSVNLLRP